MRKAEFDFINEKMKKALLILNFCRKKNYIKNPNQMNHSRLTVIEILL